MVVAHRVDAELGRGNQQPVDGLLYLAERDVAQPSRGQRSEGALVALPLVVGVPGETGPEEPIRDGPALETEERRREIVGLTAVLVCEVEPEPL